MQPENEIARERMALPPVSIPMDDTPVPAEVVETVEALQAEGKKVNVKISQADYAKLMQMPHEDRLKYALKVMAAQDRRNAARADAERRLAESRKRRRATSKLKRQQRRKARK